MIKTNKCEYCKKEYPWVNDHNKNWILQVDHRVTCESYQYFSKKNDEMGKVALRLRVNKGLINRTGDQTKVKKMTDMLVLYQQALELVQLKKKIPQLVNNRFDSNLKEFEDIMYNIPNMRLALPERRKLITTGEKNSVGAISNIRNEEDRLLAEYVWNKLEERNGDFLTCFIRAVQHADASNLELLKPALKEIMIKYPLSKPGRE